MDKKQHKAWQKFEKEYKISENYQPNEQVIFTAFIRRIKKMIKRRRKIKKYYLWILK